MSHDQPIKIEGDILAVGSRGFDDFAIGNFRATSREYLYKLADIARIYRLKPRVALSENRKYRQVAGKSCKPLVAMSKQVQPVP